MIITIFDSIKIKPPYEITPEILKLIVSVSEKIGEVNAKYLVTQNPTVKKMKEYKIAKGWTIFIYIIAPVFITLFLWLLFLPIIPGMENEINPNSYWFIAILSLAMIAFMVIGVIDAYKGKFVIEKNRIFTDGVFSKKELMLNEIKGYRLTDKFIFIESKNENKKGIKISSYFEKTSEIKEWLSHNFSDLDIVQANMERDEILKNQEFGSNTEEREAKLTKAFQTAKILNWIGGSIGAWTLFFPTPYEYAILASILFPIICLIIIKYHKGLIRVDERKGTAYPTIFWAIFASAMGLLIRGLLDFHISDYSKIWLPSVIILLAYLAVLCIGNKEFTRNDSKINLTILGFAIFIYAYSYSLVVTLNCIYDKSQPILYNSTVLNKRISTGKTKTYYLKLTPWGTAKEAEEVSVSRDLYDKLEYNEKVNIYFMKGRFEIPWYEITEN